MKQTKITTMREVFIGGLLSRMKNNYNIYFLSDDFGSPMLDGMRRDYKDRFINIGIAEQNLINVATGLALEGFDVYVYGIATFLTMRAYEQIRINLSLLSQLRPVNVNLIGVGAGLSYDVSGPTHHCLEDLSIIRTLPNIEIFSPSDCTLVERYIDYSIRTKSPKYLRFDSKPVPQIYKRDEIKLNWGFKEITKGIDICLISTGFMTQRAINVVKALTSSAKKIGLIDIFLLRPLDEKQLLKVISGYKTILTLEEGFINKGGLDSLISSIVSRNKLKIRQERLGFGDNYSFEVGSRDYLHKLYGLDESGIVKFLNSI